MVAWQEMGAWEPPLEPLGGRPPRGPVEQHGLGAWLAVRQVDAWAWDRALELLEKAACSALSH